MKKDARGHVLTWVMGFLTAVSIIMVAVSSVLNLVLSDSVRTNQYQLALNIADAGVNYYLWHMSHAGADFQDGHTGGTPISGGEFDGFYGPYVHDYKDDNGVIAGKYTLYIKPKSVGSTIAIVRSIGDTNNGKYRRSVEVEIGAPSFASYAMVINGPVYYGETSSVDGPVHSNTGVRMDAAGNADVTSPNATYVPTTTYGGSTNFSSHPGVWCGAGANCAQRNATRNNGSWRFPVTNVNFASITGELCTIKKKAFAAVPSTASLATTANACSNVSASRTAAYIPRYQAGYSAQRGWLIELNTNGTYNLYSVSNETYSYTNNTNYTNSYTSALTRSLVANNIAIPEPGVIFVEDNVWIRTNPTFHGRVTIASARLASASESTNIIIADDVKYSTKNGEDAIGLIAEDNIIVAPYAPPMPSAAASNYPFEINAAFIAKDGSTGVVSTYGSNSRPFPYWGDPNKKLLYYGSNAVNESAAWAFGTSNGFGYRDNVYDYNLLYAPPPSFPITSTYDILRWREILVTP